jgi:hypothetical protein
MELRGQGHLAPCAQAGHAAPHQRRPPQPNLALAMLGCYGVPHAADATGSLSSRAMKRVRADKLSLGYGSSSTSVARPKHISIIQKPDMRYHNARTRLFSSEAHERSPRSE